MTAQTRQNVNKHSNSFNQNSTGIDDMSRQIQITYPVGRQHHSNMHHMNYWYFLTFKVKSPISTQNGKKPQIIISYNDTTESGSIIILNIYVKLAQDSWFPSCCPPTSDPISCEHHILKSKCSINFKLHMWMYLGIRKNPIENGSSCIRNGCLATKKTYKFNANFLWTPYLEK